LVGTELSSSLGAPEGLLLIEGPKLGIELVDGVMLGCIETLGSSLGL
jgi:hypothetical protein